MQTLERYGIPEVPIPRSKSRAFPARLRDWSTEAIVKSAAEFAARALPATHVFVSEISATGRAFRLRAAVGFRHRDETSTNDAVTADQAETMSVLSRGVCLVDSENRTLAERVSAMLGGVQISSGASVPIRHGGEAWGVFGAYSANVRRFDTSQVRLLKEVSGHLERTLWRTSSVDANILAAKQEWEAAVDALSQLFLVLDSDGRVIRTNKIAELWGCGKVGSAKGQHLCDILKLITRYSASTTSLCWADIRKRLLVERLLEWEVQQEPCGPTFRLSLRAIPAGVRRQQDNATCFAVLVIDNVTGLKTACEAERQLHLLSCQLIDAQEMARKKIAADLHDSIGQIMSAVKYQVEALMETSIATQPSSHEQMSSIVTNLQYAMEEVRKITQVLRPSTLDDLGLLITIDWFCREFRALYSGCQIDKELAVDESAISEARKIAIYRIIQEAMSNIAKHAKATAIQLQLCQQKDSLHLRILDNGQGFDVARLSRAPCYRGFGLRSMRERVEATGGTFMIESHAGEGTTVQAHWPTCTEAQDSLRK